MGRIPLLAPVLVLVVALAGCAGAPAEPSATNTARPSTTAAPEPSSMPDSASTLVITLDGLNLESGAADETADYRDPDAVVGLVEEIIGSAPAVERDEAHALTTYDWTGMRVLVVDGGPAAVAVSSPDLGGVAVTTAEGVAVGATRAQAIAAGAWESDTDGDGVAEMLGIGERDVPDTVSLTHPDRTGIEFVLLMPEGDVIAQIQSPSNDFADI